MGDYSMRLNSRNMTMDYASSPSASDSSLLTVFPVLLVGTSRGFTPRDLLPFSDLHCIVWMTGWLAD